MSFLNSTSNQTATQTNMPPAYLMPYINRGLTDSLNIYNQGPAQYYPGQTVVPFSSQTTQALDLMQQRALAGSPVTQNANTYATDVLGGKYLGQNNQYLDATFKRAADAVQNRIQSGFASAGRNVGAGAGLAAQQMNDLATQIYGGAYENERNRMQSILPMAGQLASEDYADYDRLLGVGGLHEELAGRTAEDAASRWDFEQNAPGVALDQFNARVRGAPGSTMSSTTPLYRNHAADALGGALAGYRLGDQFGGNGGMWGSVIGGLLGGWG